MPKIIGIINPFVSEKKYKGNSNNDNIVITQIVRIGQFFFNNNNIFS